MPAAAKQAWIVLWTPALNVENAAWAKGWDRDDGSMSALDFVDADDYRVEVNAPTFGKARSMALRLRKKDFWGMPRVLLMELPAGAPHPNAWETRQTWEWDRKGHVETWTD